MDQQTIETIQRKVAARLNFFRLVKDYRQVQRRVVEYTNTTQEEVYQYRKLRDRLDNILTRSAEVLLEQGYLVEWDGYAHFLGKSATMKRVAMCYKWRYEARDEAETPRELQFLIATIMMRKWQTIMSLTEEKRRCYNHLFAWQNEVDEFLHKGEMNDWLLFLKATYDKLQLNHNEQQQIEQYVRQQMPAS